MITREELSDVLKKAGFKGKAIQRILSKNIRTILDRGNADKMASILELLNDFKISKESIEDCLLVLTRGYRTNKK